MNGNCPASCTDIEILSNPIANCIDELRRKTLSRFIFYPCSLALPSPITNEAMKALYDANSLSFTNRLGNIVVADPQTEDLMIDECSTARKVINTRVITCEDRIAVKTHTDSPAIENDYFDYDYWNNKNEQQLQMNVMLAYCDGDVIIPVDANGDALSFTMLAFLSWQKPQQQGGAWVEFKKIEMNFRGDPLAMTLKPSWNWQVAGIAL